MPNQRHKLERIDIDELFSSPVNRGMLSFLERPPEEAQARLREKQKVNAIDAGRLEPGGELPSGSPLQEATALPCAEADRQQLCDLRLPASHQGVTSPVAVSRDSSPPVVELPPGGELPSAPVLPIAGDAEASSPDLLGSSPPVLVDSPSLLPSFDSRVSTQVSINHPEGELPSVAGGLARSNSPSGHLSIPVGNSHTGTMAQTDSLSASKASYPVGDLPSGQHSSLPTHADPDPSASFQSGDFSFSQEEDFAPPRKPQSFWNRNRRHPQGNSPRERQSSLNTNHRISMGGLIRDRELDDPALPKALDGAVVGRRQKVRRAIVAQDGHSSGEQLLYQALWNAASVETPETRLLSIGYSGMSALCKLEKSNCKKNVQGLIQKLAVEITEHHQSVSSTGTTYRIFSYKEILRRREIAGMVWVVRTSGVRFVYPGGNLPPASEGELLGGAGGESLPPPVGNPAPGGEGISPRGPLGKTHTQLEMLRNKQVSFLSSASDNIGQLCIFARSQIAEFDDDACRLLWRKCQEVAPDCTIAEVIDCFDLKARQLFTERVRNVANPVGLMIWAVPKMFEGPEALYRQRRRAKAEEAAKAAEAVAQFERNRADWKALLDHPSTSEEDRQFYRKLLGNSDREGG